MSSALSKLCSSDLLPSCAFPVGNSSSPRVTKMPSIGSNMFLDSMPSTMEEEREPC
jgi:hypothetical protein